MEGSPKVDDKLHWYKDAVIYELHIKAFRDSNGDGIGDFGGLLEKLDYLQDLGVTAIWVLPFYPSPLRDDGYDIADYYSINPAYGNIKQFKQFLKEAHRRKLKVITELVINHTSDQHPWFQRARNAPKGSPERDYYVWSDTPEKYRDVRIIFQDFESSNWSWDPVAQQYYWHRFFSHQPDLNYDNPLVKQEIFKILDYWCAMGVDGFRLDAVPYLFEREGTNCENLEETHDFLKELRAHVDKHYPGTLLLAEANMWPEDSASYFGDGDECHMNYHFPVMPRMFMSLQMEDRYPLTDIFEQTPPIPEICQWAIFLRNHDELTLEMVTDEERDYMYKVYVRDPKARINLGIRHRLAPLTSNNRRKVELLNCLLFSLRGTPVLYYGDEIGMGDNFYLGDRDGVRTPMQWSPDRNAGFSSANPQQLYLPVISDPEYHYESVNVETQHRNTSSLLWFMKRIINMRKKHKAFSRGDMKFISVENPKILAFTRTFRNEIMLVVVNLSRFSQAAELDLRAFKGYQPVEVFSKNKFPVITENAPYFFTMSPHAYQWFSLELVKEHVANDKSLYTIQLDQWKDLFLPAKLEELENEVLQDYLIRMRWFGAKGRIIQRIRVENIARLPPNGCDIAILLIEVNYESGLPETYQLPLTFVESARAERLIETYPQSVIANAVLAGKDGYLCDAIFTPEMQQKLFVMMASGQHVDLKGQELKFYSGRSVRKFLKENPEINSRILSVEQSNTSVTYANTYFLKIYRKVDKAINPDMEVTRFLTEVAKFPYIPAFEGGIEWKDSKEPIVLGMLQQMVSNHGDAWSFMQERVHNYFERILARNPGSQQVFELAGSFADPVSFEKIHPDLQELIGVNVAERVSLLGERTGEMHIALASGVTPDFKPEEFSLHYQRSLFSSLQSLLREAYDRQVKTFNRLPEELKDDAKYVLARKEEVTAILKRIYTKKFDVHKIRIHGDYHLGQVLFTGKDLVILDFEGEPARRYSERRLKRSALRDVAGMLRSFHYAVFDGLLMNHQIRKKDIDRLRPFADLWYHYVGSFFMHSYLEAVKGRRFVPSDKSDLMILLQCYLLEKAFYELNYELNNRPDWVRIPLKGIISLIENVNTQVVEYENR